MYLWRCMWKLLWISLIVSLKWLVTDIVKNTAHSTASPESIHCLDGMSPFLLYSLPNGNTYHMEASTKLWNREEASSRTQWFCWSECTNSYIFRHSLASSTWWFGIEGEHAKKFCVRPISVVLGCAAFWRGEVGGCCCAWYNGHGIGLRWSMNAVAPVGLVLDSSLLASPRGAALFSCGNESWVLGLGPVLVIGQELPV